MRVNRKILSIILCIVMISVFSLTIAYAALNAVLNISGSAEVSASSWDVYLLNVQVKSGSVNSDKPVISGGNTVSFSTTLNMPGEFFEFTVDVINNGSIDAMIDSVTKSPTLSSSQAKYLNYIIEYQNGEAITTKQLVKKNSYVRLKVRLEYRSDLVSSDLPTSSETLNLSFTVNYTQSDGTGSSITNNGVRTISFMIEGETYYALDGQQWYYWVTSSYNTGEFFINDYDEVAFSNSCYIVEYHGLPVKNNDIIQENYDYSSGTSPC